MQLQMQTSNITVNMIRTVIQIGDRTHHHDHPITPVSLRTMKVMVRSPVKPIPEDVLDEELEPYYLVTFFSSSFDLSFRILCPVMLASSACLKKISSSVSDLGS